MKGKIFKCIKGFAVSKWDNDNDCFSDEIIDIEQGSLWNCTGYGYICDGEIRLENLDTVAWLEISTETLQEFFEEITDNSSGARKE